MIAIVWNSVNNSSDKGRNRQSSTKGFPINTLKELYSKNNIPLQSYNDTEKCTKYHHRHFLNH